jgi:hypothetical protein
MGKRNVMEERKVMETTVIREPPDPWILITPLSASVSITSGQRASATFTMHKHYTNAPVSLSVGPLPQGISAAFNPQSPANDQEFSLTLTAAPDVSPAEATIRITASATGVDDANASVIVNATATGQVRPSYHLLTVVYAPPGTNGGRSSSQVVYGSESTTGTTDSTSNSFKEGVTVTASAGVDIGIVNLGGSAEFTASQTSTSSSSVEINKSSNNEITVTGPSEDGINHDYDIFYLWLNPLLTVTLDHLNNLTWEIGVDGPTMDIQYVYASWLKDPSQMPPGVAQKLAGAGLTAADYAQILAADPFSSGSTTIDFNRFVPTTHSFPYEPPVTANDPVPTITYSQTNSTTFTNTQEVDNEYGVTATVSAGIQVFYDAKLQVSGSLEWTNKSTTTQTTGATQSASVTIGGPSFGYTGPTDVNVYWDTVFSSFMFAFAATTPVAVGTLVDSAGDPIPHKRVTLSTNGRRLRTFTDAHGVYRFYNMPPGGGTISVGNQEFPVAIGSREPRKTLAVTA